jgi:lysophospholipase L1-like esterase
MAKNLVVAALSTLLTLLVGEGALRLFSPTLAGDWGGQASAPRKESPFIFSDRIGYELKPGARIESQTDGVAAVEQLNSDGFRGPEYAIPKPSGSFRILAVGDSVVQALSVSYRDSWGQVLEAMLNRRVPSSDSGYELINAGIGGYVTWQALVRLEDRGLKYQPDLILLLTGWNDLLFSSLPSWAPDIDLSKIEQAYARGSQTPEKAGVWAKIRVPIYEHSYVARLARRARNRAWNARRIQALVTERQIPSGIPFNRRALDLYLENLERIERRTTEAGARLGLILWPTLLEPDLLEDSEVQRRLLVIYSNFPLSTREIWAWYVRYIDAQRDFLKRHPKTIPIDAAAAFAALSREQRLRMFLDLAHLTVEGNRRLADVVLQALVERGEAP